MSRTLGYSAERAPDGRVVLVHIAPCITCWGRGTLATSWTVTCPNGCTFEAHGRPVARDVKCPKCPGRWDSGQFHAVEVKATCYDCGGSGRRGSETMFEPSEARALRDALTAALGDRPAPLDPGDIDARERR